jgi:hypothetical protein
MLVRAQARQFVVAAAQWPKVMATKGQPDSVRPWLQATSNTPCCARRRAPVMSMGSAKAKPSAEQGEAQT